MELYQLETFLTVAAEKSFSRAATRLHRTQPAVSQVIRKLESDLGEVLFERASRDGSLTAAGEVLREYAQKMVSLRREATSALEELRSLERGRLHLAANEYTCLYLLPVLDQFRKLCPQIGVTVQRSFGSRIPDDLLQRTVEIGILTYRPPEGFDSVRVYTDELAFVVNPQHPLTRESHVSIRDLGAENFIAHNVPSPLRRRVIEAFEFHKTPLNMGFELPSLEAIKRFVAMGNGVALVPGLTVQQELGSGQLVRIPVPELCFERELRLVYRTGASLSHAAGAFLKVVSTVAATRGKPFLYSAEALDPVHTPPPAKARRARRAGSHRSAE
ncbi:MAG TPA: LysR family transcriptional regulator [Acidisarcina sp.]